jgi:hypothetical protein
MFPCPGWEHQSIWIYLGKGHHISLTWIVGPFGDEFPIKNHDSRVLENSEVVIIYLDGSIGI